LKATNGTTQRDGRKQNNPKYVLLLLKHNLLINNLLTLLNICKMKKLIIVLAVAIYGLLAFQSCGEANRKTDIVDSGTYQGVAEEVDPGEQEIYVRTADGKLLELYFTDQTTLTKADGSSAEFSELTEDGNVEVQVEKMGRNKLEPIAVKIL
jgi:hypothetical protein